MRVWQQFMIHLARSGSVKKFMQQRAAMSKLATRFVGGADVNEVTEKSLELTSQGYQVSLFYLGEYVEDLTVINQTALALKSIAGSLKSNNLDRFICVDPTQIGYHRDNELGRKHAFEIAGEIKRLTDAADHSSRNFLMLDMEDSSVTDGTIRLYEALKSASLPVALTLQAYLHRTENDLEKILPAGGAVRLVKGAFAERSEIALTNRSEISRRYLKLAKRLLSAEARQSGFYPIFATHDDSLIGQITEVAQSQGWTKEMYEFEMLYGVRVELQEKLLQKGNPLTLYLPFGIDWWPYAVRRVGESPRNARFLLRSLLGA